MTWPTYEPSDLAEFTGDPTVAQLPFAPQAIMQATLLLQAATCLYDIPEGDPLAVEFMKMAVMSIADSFILKQPHREVLANPFVSENIGSYSYSKRQAYRTTQAVVNGMPTGDTWFDIAVGRYGVCDASFFASGGVAVFEYDGIFRAHSVDDTDHMQLLGPADFNNERSVRDVVSPLFDPDRNVEVVGGGEEIVWDDPEMPHVPDGWQEDPDNPGFVIAP